MKKLLRMLLISALLPACRAASVSQASIRPEIVVLYTKDEPIIPVLPANCCEYVPLEGFANPGKRRASTVIVAGHGKPPYYASHSYQQVAAAVASFKPELVVMNSCYGASEDILGALSQAKLDAYVVAAPFPIYQPGFVYEPAFFKGRLIDKVMAVHTQPEFPILRWKISSSDLQRVEAAIASLPVKELRKRLRRVKPALVRMPMPTTFDKNSEILVPLPAERFR